MAEDPPSRCRVCFCTEEKPCPSGCARVRKDLCSECLPLEGQEVAVLSDLLLATSANLVGLPWPAYLRALDDPKLQEEVVPPKFSPDRQAMMLRHIRRMAEEAVRWKDLVLEAQKEMARLGPMLEVAAPVDIPPRPRILRP